MSVDLTTTYLGFDLANPLVASSSPLTGNVDTLRRLEAAGAAAVVLPSLFEEQIEFEALEVQRVMEFGAESFAEAMTGYFPELNDYNTGPGSYLEHVEAAKSAVSVPVIASLNGTTRGGWVRYAKKLQEAGADALELNIYLIPTDPYASATDVENRYLDLVRAVRESVSIPMAVKVGPYFSSMAYMARQLADAGANSLVLFNRFYQPDIDLEEMTVVPNVKLSEPIEVRLPLRWIAILYGKVRCDLAVTTGIHTPSSAIKAMLVGANVAMMASSLLKHGPEHLGTVLSGLEIWMEEHEYSSVKQMRGSMAMTNAPNPDEYIRSNYMRMLTTYTSEYV